MGVLEQPAEIDTAGTAVASPPHDAGRRIDSTNEGPIETNPDVERETIPPPDALPEVALGVRLQLHRFQRITGIVGMALLIAGLAVWRFRPHTNDRLALLILICAMFLAILHHYSMEENRRSGNGNGGATRAG